MEKPNRRELERPGEQVMTFWATRSLAEFCRALNINVSRTAREALTKEVIKRARERLTPEPQKGTKHGKR